MNQTTNLIQWKNLTDGQKAEFDFENYRYEWQTDDKKWMEALGLDIDNIVYRLGIEPDKWYWGGLDYTNVAGPILGRDISTEYDTLRPCKPSEIPEPEPTLEDKIKAKWPEYEVIMLEWTGDYLLYLDEDCDTHRPHITAQSMKVFYEYCYFGTEGLFSDNEPTIKAGIETIHPVAVLFKASK